MKLVDALEAVTILRGKYRTCGGTEEIFNDLCDIENWLQNTACRRQLECNNISCCPLHVNIESIKYAYDVCYVQNTPLISDYKNMLACVHLLNSVEECLLINRPRSLTLN